jgi:flagellar basal-body rod modification protein FlgD
MTVSGVTPAAAAASAAATRAGLFATSPATASASAGSTAPVSSSAAPAKATSSGSAKTMAGQLSTPNLFLKLLMAELTHENPTNPTTPSSILQQTAMLSQLESMTAMATAVNQQRRYAASADANGLIGRQVTAFVTGHDLTGVVSGVGVTSSGTPYLDINNTFVPLASVVEVTTPSTGTTPATPATGGTTTASTGTTPTTPATGGKTGTPSTKPTPTTSSTGAASGAPGTPPPAATAGSTAAGTTSP